MAIDIKPIVELRKYEFTIPNYQRGYRWDSEQVEALLNDLETFRATQVENRKRGERNNEYYCLQPVVVVPKETRKGNTKFIVVDGQQRLTTLYLIIKALEGQNAQCFTMKMDQRKEQEFYLASGDYETDIDSYTRNIDNFYVKKAYDTIKKWENNDPKKKRTITMLLDNDDEDYAAVLWCVIEESDALQTFRRLNYGKIPLTPAELVKAIILQTDCYPSAERELQNALAQRRAMEWDDMEHRLADPLFAAMVTNKDNKPGSGIEIVLDFVADSLNETLKKEKPESAASSV